MNSSPIETWAESSFFGRGTTRILGLPNTRFRYASSFLTSLTSTASLQSKSGLARVLGRDATNRQHELPKNFWDEGAENPPLPTSSMSRLRDPSQSPISETHGVDHLIHGARRLGAA